MGTEPKRETKHFSLSFGERSFVAMVAQRGGEILFDWDKVSPDDRARKARVHRSVDSLVKIGLLTRSPIDSHTERLRLTDAGRQVADLVMTGAPIEMDKAKE